jgi:hypothetical protein
MKDEEYAQLSRKNINNISKEDVSRMVEYEYSNPDKQCHGSFTVKTLRKLRAELAHPKDDHA